MTLEAEMLRVGTLNDDVGNPLDDVAAFEKVLDRMQMVCREELKVTGGVEPCAHFLFEENGEFKLATFQMGKYFREDVRGKNTASDLMLAISRKLNAFAMVMVTEAWAAMMEGKNSEESVEEARAKMPNSMEDWPEDMRKEVVNIMIEHAKLGSGMLFAEIIRSGEKATVGDFNTPGGEGTDELFKQGVSIGGRFSGRIPATDKSAN